MSKCELRVINANYERVLAVIEKFRQDRHRDFCGCSRCMSDVAVIALNYLPPHYVVEDDLASECGSPWVMVETAVNEAIERVLEQPRHARTELRHDRKHWEG